MSLLVNQTSINEDTSFFGSGGGGGAVASVAGLTGAVLMAGSGGITVTPNSGTNTITVSGASSSPTVLVNLVGSNNYTASATGNGSPAQPAVPFAFSGNPVPVPLTNGGTVRIDMTVVVNSQTSAVDPGLISAVLIPSGGSGGASAYYVASSNLENELTKCTLTVSLVLTNTNNWTQVTPGIALQNSTSAQTVVCAINTLSYTVY